MSAALAGGGATLASVSATVSSSSLHAGPLSGEFVAGFMIGVALVMFATAIVLIARSGRAC